VTAEGATGSNGTIATAVLVKPAGGDQQTAKGRLLLFGPSGKPLVEVADGVRALHVAAVSGDTITVLFERDRQLVVASFATGSLVRRQEQSMAIPALK
jgi:hypothetical protein